MLRLLWGGLSYRNDCNVTSTSSTDRYDHFNSRGGRQLYLNRLEKEDTADYKKVGNATLLLCCHAGKPVWLMTSFVGLGDCFEFCKL